MAEKLEVIITATDNASGVLRGLGGIARGALTIGLGIATAAAGALAGGLAWSIKEAMDAQAVQAQLGAVLKSTGGIAGVTADMAIDLSNSLAEVTRFSDEAVLAGENILLTFTKIGKDIFPQATEIALDMSQALGQDVKSSAIQLGKALQDPILGVTALSRVGVNFTDKQKKMIEGLVKAGKIEEAQALILKELQTEFGGSAKAAGETFAGQLDILKNSLSNVAEGIGMSLLPIGMDLMNKFILPAVPKIQAMAKTFTDNFAPAIQEVGRLLLELKAGDFSKLFGHLATIGYDLALAFGFSEDQAYGLWQGILSLREPFDAIMVKVKELSAILFDWIQTTIVPFVTLHAEEFKGALIGIGVVLAGAAIIGGILAIVGAIAALANPITLIIAAAALLGAAWAGNWGGIREKTQAVIDFLKPYIEGFITGIQAWWATNGPLIIAKAKEIWDGIQEKTAEVIAFLKPLIEGFIAGIQDWWATNGPLIIAKAQEIWDGIKAGFEWFKGIFKGIVDAFHSAQEGDWRGFGEKLRKVFDEIWTKIKEIVGTAIENIKNKFKDTDWGAVGKGIIDGIAKGITAGLQWLKDAAIAAAKAALEAAKGFLGIDSPSKVFAVIGQQMMAGMAIGVKASAGLPRGAVNAAAAGTTGVSVPSGRGGVYLEVNVYPSPGMDENQLAARAAEMVVRALGSNRSMRFAG